MLHYCLTGKLPIFHLETLLQRCFQSFPNHRKFYPTKKLRKTISKTTENHWQVDVLELPYSDASKSLLVVMATDGDSTDLVAKARKLKFSTIRQQCDD